MKPILLWFVKRKNKKKITTCSINLISKVESMEKRVLLQNLFLLFFFIVVLSLLFSFLGGSVLAENAINCHENDLHNSTTLVQVSDSCKESSAVQPMAIDGMSGGDLIVNDNRTVIIEDATYVHTGNVIVEDFGTLIIRNATFQLTLESDWQYNFTIRNNGTLQLDRGMLISNYASKLLLENQANLITENNSKIEFNSILATDDTKLYISNTSVKVEYFNVSCKMVTILNSFLDARSIIEESGGDGIAIASINSSSSSITYSTINVESRGGYLAGNSLSSLYIASSSSVFISNSRINIISYEYSYFLALSSFTIVSPLTSISSLVANLDSSTANHSGARANSSLIFVSQNLSIRSSKIIVKSESPRVGPWQPGPYSLLFLDASSLKTFDTNIVAITKETGDGKETSVPIKIGCKDAIAYLYNVTTLQDMKIEAMNNTIIFRYWYLILTVEDNKTTPIPWANVGVFYKLNNSKCFSTITDSCGKANILLLSQIITSNQSLFVGNYVVNASYWYGYYNISYDSARKSVTMINNVALTLSFPGIIYPVIIDDTFTTSGRCNVGSTQNVGFHLSWGHNGTSISYGQAYINGTGYVTNETGWLVFSVHYDTVGRRTWIFTSVNCSGVTGYGQIVQEPTIIWDKVEITLIVPDSRIDIGTTANIQKSAIYAFDATPFNGVINLNDTETKNSVGIYGYKVLNISDPNYGLTVFTTNEVYVIFDKVQLTISTLDNRVDVGSTAVVDVTGTYAYDGLAWSGTYALNDTLTKNVVGKYSYRIISITDNNYGLTIFECNAISIIFDRVEITLSISDNRIDVGSAMHWNFSAIYAYDGINANTYLTINLNDTTTKNVVGKWAFKVASITDSLHGLTVFETNVIECIWDRIKITNGGVSNSHCQVGSIQTIWVYVQYEYDLKRFDDACGFLFINDEPMIWSDMNSRWECTVTSNIICASTYEISSVNDTLFQLTAVQDNVGKISIIWDRIEVIEITANANSIGTIKVKVKAIYNYTQDPLSGANVTVNGMQCMEIEPGTYTCEITSWSPMQGLSIRVNQSNFAPTTKDISLIHAPNLTLYFIICVAGIVTIILLIKYFRRLKTIKTQPYSMK